MKRVSLSCLVILLISACLNTPAQARGDGHGGGYGGYGGGNHFNGGGHYGAGYHGGGSGGNGFGYYGPSYGYGQGYYGGYYPPYYGGGYPSTIVPMPSTPPLYIQENQQPAAQNFESGYWYYCDNPAGYYPKVRQCNNDWQQVAPSQPPLPPAGTPPPPPNSFQNQ